MNNEKEVVLTETERRSNAIKEKYLKISTGGVTLGVFGTLGVFAVLGGIATSIIYILPNILPKISFTETAASGVGGISFVEMIGLAGSILMVPFLIFVLFLLGVKICEIVELASLDKK